MHGLEKIKALNDFCTDNDAECLLVSGIRTNNVITFDHGTHRAIGTDPEDECGIDDLPEPLRSRILHGANLEDEEDVSLAEIFDCKEYEKCSDCPATDNDCFLAKK